jgi:hypothetical protein
MYRIQQVFQCLITSILQCTSNNNTCQQITDRQLLLQSPITKTCTCNNNSSFQTWWLVSWISKQTTKKYPRFTVHHINRFNHIHSLIHSISTLHTNLWSITNKRHICSIHSLCNSNNLPQIRRIQCRIKLLINTKHKLCIRTEMIYSSSNLIKKSISCRISLS